MNQPNAPGSLAPSAKRGERVRERGSRSHPVRTQINPKTEMERVKIRQDAGAEILWTIPKAVWWGGGSIEPFWKFRRMLFSCPRGSGSARRGSIPHAGLRPTSNNARPNWARKPFGRRRFCPWVLLSPSLQPATGMHRQFRLAQGQNPRSQHPSPF